ncbi:transcriptional regulator SutA [Pseudomonas abyssi]|uniref:transcriptional regulator SutA n=1 Tax=Pseudomonas abyssi TaxID=170540 RepID=UPI003C7D6E33
MSDDLDDDLDGMDDSEVDDQDDVTDGSDDGDDGDDGAEVSSKSRKKKAAASDDFEGASMEAKEREREMLARQIEEFMARGGKVQQIDDNVVSDPPKKPENKYGSRPI